MTDNSGVRRANCNSAPEEGAQLIILAIVILAVRSEEPLHDPADGVPPPLDEQMNVIGIKAVA